MAAEILPSSPGNSLPGGSGGCVGNSSSPELLNKFEGGADEVNSAVMIPGESKGVITISNDRYSTNCPISSL